MRLALFMTYGGSLAGWRDAGILERELALYQAHAEAGSSTVIVSYGGRDDLDIARGFPFVEVLCNARGLHPRLYGLLAPRLHRAALTDSDVIKTNQLYGARQALAAGRLIRRPVVIRQGYGLVEHTRRDHGRDSRQARWAIAYERACLPRATVCQFTTAEIADQCAARVPLDRSAIEIVPNYVADTFWSPPFDGYRELDAGRPLRIAYYGRFTEQKNLESLVSAAASTGAELHLIGDGPLRDQLGKLAAEAGVHAEFPGRLDHAALRDRLHRCDAFACVSHYEGHPKSVIEAMTFGIPVIAADSPGIAPLIADGRTGILVAPTVEGISTGLRRLRDAPPEARRALGRAARESALERYSVRAIATLERQIYARVARLPEAA